MKNLTRREELILLSIWNLRENAYLVGIIKHLSAVTGKKLSIGAIYIPVKRLEKYEFIEFHYGEATAKRGGHRKKVYSITQKGLEALTEYKKVNDVLWASFPGFEFK